jgi:aspartate racemase
MVGGGQHRGMKTIGLIGGMSWRSTESYYRRINEVVAGRLGGHSSAQLTLQSLNFAEIRECQLRGDWAASGALIAAAGRRCVAGGADLIGLCTNLMHKNFDELEAASDVPVVHIADAVAAQAKADGQTRLGLLGTEWVMRESFYTDRLGRHGISVVVPDDTAMRELDRIVFDELTQGRFLDRSREVYLEVMAGLAARGAQAVVLACTEIGLLVSPGQAPVPMIDSATAHADLLAEYALTGPRVTV